jgi:hypothetical protein
MDANKMPRKILYEKIYTKRVTGRPKSRWFDDVREDLRILKVTKIGDPLRWKEMLGGQGPQRAAEPVGKVR